MSEPTDTMKEKARELVDDLLTNGLGQTGERLLIVCNGVADMGGWGRKPLEDKISAALTQAEAEGAKKERAAVVRWLRPFSFLNVDAAADGIERGDHLKGEGA